MVQGLHVHGHALGMVLLDPLAGSEPGARRIVVVVLAVVIQQVGTGAEAEDHALLEFLRIEVGPLAGVIQVLVGDELPGLDLDVEADGRAAVGIDGKLVGVPGAFALEVTLHDVARRVGMGAGVHHDGDFLAENTGLGMAVHRVDDRLLEIRPERYVSTERMAQINEYFLSHFLFLLFMDSSSAF